MSAVAADRVGPRADGPLRSVELTISGMTCASCAVRIERRLSKLAGVEAAVNFATESARVSFPGTVSADDLLAAVAQAGYTAALPRAADDAAAPSTRTPGDPDEATALRRRLVVSVTLAIPVVVLAMVPALQFPNWQWVVARAGHPGGGLGGVAVPPGCAGQPAPRRRHDGHADLGRGQCRLPVVAVRAVLRHAGALGCAHGFSLLARAPRLATSTSRSPPG